MYTFFRVNQFLYQSLIGNDFSLFKMNSLYFSLLKYSRYWNCPHYHQIKIRWVDFRKISATPPVILFSKIAIVWLNSSWLLTEISAPLSTLDLLLETKDINSKSDVWTMGHNMLPMRFFVWFRCGVTWNTNREKRILVFILFSVLLALLH